MSFFFSHLNYFILFYLFYFISLLFKDSCLHFPLTTSPNPSQGKEVEMDGIVSSENNKILLLLFYMWLQRFGIKDFGCLLGVQAVISASSGNSM